MADEVDLRSVAGRVVPLALTTGLAGALLYYFGWVSTREELRIYGLSSALIDYSYAYYLLNSLATVVHPAKLLVLIVVGAVALFALLTVWANRLGRRATWLYVALVLAGATLVVVFDRVMFFRPAYWLGIRGDRAAIVWTFGAALIVFGVVRLWRHRGSGGAGLARDVVLGALGMLVVLGLFIAVAQVAVQEGVHQAEQTIRRQDNLRDLTVVAAAPLGLEQYPGVTVRVDRSGGADKAIYEYEGLKFLVRSGSRFVAFPAELELGRSPLIVLDEEDLLRIDIVRPRPAP